MPESSTPGHATTAAVRIPTPIPDASVGLAGVLCDTNGLDASIKACKIRRSKKHKRKRITSKDY